VADRVQFSNGNLQWNISFTKPMHDWEVDLITSFFGLLTLLYSLKLRQGGEHKVCWIPSKSRKFEERSFYHALCTPTGSPFPFKSI
jgi:hypothetical protein